MSAAVTRADLESAVERAIALLDAWDGDPDAEPECEDEGAQCDDEGVESDREPDQDDEASLCGVTFGCGRAIDLGRHGGLTYDLEATCEDEGVSEDYE